MVALGTNILGVFASRYSENLLRVIQGFRLTGRLGRRQLRDQAAQLFSGPVVSLSSFSQSTSTSEGSDSSFDEDVSPLEPLVRHSQIDGVGLGFAADELCQHR